MISRLWNLPAGPVIDAAVYFPGLGMRPSPWTFLVDSGSSISCLVESDLSAAVADYRVLNLLPAPPGRGFGGNVDRHWLDAVIDLAHTDGEHSIIDVRFSVIGLAEPDSVRGMPSVIGRDVLALGVLTLDAPSRLVSLDLPLGRLRAV
jgi:hypothetical protein